MSVIPHRKADSPWEGLQYNPFAPAAALQRGIAEAQAQTQPHPALGSQSLMAFPTHPSLTRWALGHQAQPTEPQHAQKHRLSILCPHCHQGPGAEYWRTWSAGVAAGLGGPAGRVTDCHRKPEQQTVRKANNPTQILLLYSVVAHRQWTTVEPNLCKLFGCMHPFSY